jgi:hypothetical protein
MLVAACGSASPTPDPSNAIVTMAPTQSPAPSPTDDPDGTPATTPSGPVAPVVVDPWSEAAVLATLLHASDVPKDLSPDDVRVLTTDETPGWVEHAGLRVAKRNWGGRGAVSSLFDLRFQFPSAQAAQGFLEDAREALSEEGAGLQYIAGSPLGDSSYRYSGTISFGGIQTNNYNYLVRVENIVAKVFVGGGPELDLLTADAIAERVPARMRAALKGGIAASPSASTGFPSEAEAALLAHIPENLHMGCGPVEEIYPNESATVRCKPFNGPNIDYTAFSNGLDMTEAYQGDVDSADPAPTANGQCALGNYEWTYTVNGAPAGRILCTSYISPRTNQTFRVIEWTNDELNILAYASSATLGWGEMVEFWRGSAGPIP